MPEKRPSRVVMPGKVVELIEAHPELEKWYNEREAYEASLERRLREAEANSYRDPVTGLWNARFFAEQLPVEYERVRRNNRDAGSETRYLSFVAADIDHFKDFNDTYGHPFGNYVLRRVGEMLKSERMPDRIFRLGGEEFGVLLPYTPLDGSAFYAEERRLAVERFDATASLEHERDMKRARGENYAETQAHLDSIAGKKKPKVTISLGVAAYPHNGLIEDSVSLVQYADKALYQAKKGGRNRICTVNVFDDQTNQPRPP